MSIGHARNDGKLRDPSRKVVANADHRQRNTSFKPRIAGEERAKRKELAPMTSSIRFESERDDDCPKFWIGVMQLEDAGRVRN